MHGLETGANIRKNKTRRPLAEPVEARVACGLVLTISLDLLQKFLLRGLCASAVRKSWHKINVVVQEQPEKLKMVGYQPTLRRFAHGLEIGANIRKNEKRRPLAELVEARVAYGLVFNN